MVDVTKNENDEMLDVSYKPFVIKESQGALERFHETLKAMLRCYCLDTGKDWAEEVVVDTSAAALVCKVTDVTGALTVRMG
ncbi:hypothetical protein QQF64_023832 [Cirrhinus molitorella]|uniref:Uncharacterized protein n=1 Tax=Cirrhinus molitorella TaxID=172907 RepID=A0ABR3NJS7_9TELE